VGLAGHDLVVTSIGAPCSRFGDRDPTGGRIF
jgi:hypothetical protein